MGLALHTAEKSSSLGRKPPGQVRSVQPPITAFAWDQPQRASGQCACGGGCPRCAGAFSVSHSALAAGVLQRKCGASCDCEDCGIQKKVKIGPAGDAFEQEADHLAERLVSGSAVSVKGQVGPTVYTKRAGAGGGGESAGIDGLSGGQALPLSVQQEFGPRLGHDLSGIRMHHGEAAHRAASSVGARAFTLGRDLVFAQGEFSPDTSTGRRLLAHELVHWVQQGGSTTRLQRDLQIDRPSSDDKNTAVAQMRPLLLKLCPDFDVAETGEVTAKPDSDCWKGRFGAVATGSQKLGCCCLCTMARAPNKWKIVVTIKDSPATFEPTRTVNMTPTSGSGAPALHDWTAGNTVKLQSPEETLGHELCGHAALMQIKAHPADEDANTQRTFSDVHDPTVKIQNVLAGAGELNQGNPPRGLAASGAHRGESLRVFVVKPFTADDASISSAAEDIINGAAKYSDANADTLIDVVGFSDSSDTKAEISKQRADEVRTKLNSKLTKTDDVAFTLSPGAGETKIPRLQPAVDGGAGSAASVEIRLAAQPAGLVNLPKGVKLPSTVTHVGPEHPAVVDLVMKQGKSTGNECHDLLIKTAWT